MKVNLSKLIVIIICILFGYSIILLVHGQGVDYYIDMEGLKKTGDDWKVTYQSIENREGHIILHHDKWLMYFLHWRPLTKQNKNLSLEYTRNHLLNFWGQAINFELTGVEGEIEIGNHKGFFTEGSFSNDAIYTRFIVWNCSQTNRQFTADCNINLRRGTPEELLEVQKLITTTVCCHDDEPRIVPELPKKYESQKWNISFYTPHNWRTADFADEEWFPDGMTEQNGSLWTLLTDSQKHIELLWQKTGKNISPDLFNNLLERLTVDLTVIHDSSGIAVISLNSLEEKNSFSIGEGTYQFEQIIRGKPRQSGFRFKGLLWRNDKQVYFLLCSLIEIKEFWGIENDLAPSDETFKTYLRNEILPNIKVFNGGY